MRFSLLPSEYAAEVRTEKILRVFAAGTVAFSVALVVGIVFLLPSYFTLMFSRNDVFRRLSAEQEVFARLSGEQLEEEVERINALSRLYRSSEEQRSPWFPLLLRISRADQVGISLDSLVFSYDQKKSHTIVLQGSAENRDVFLQYVERLKNTDGFQTVYSPVSNLLKERDVRFELTIVLSPEFYVPYQ